MTKTRYPDWSAELATFVAFMLLVQAFFGGLSLGAGASTHWLGSFGGPICGVDDGARHDTAPAGSADMHHVDCCLFGCNMVGSAADTPPVTVHYPFVRSCHPGRIAVAAASPAARVELSPHHTRAPPAIT